MLPFHDPVEFFLYSCCSLQQIHNKLGVIEWSFGLNRRLYFTSVVLQLGLQRTDIVCKDTATAGNGKTVIQ